MKKIIKLILILFLVSNNTYSQKLEYSIFSESYTELVGAWHEQPIVKYDSGFRAYLQLPFNFLFNEIVSNEIDVHGPGYVNFSDFTDTVFFDVKVATFYPFRSDRIVDKSVVMLQTNNLSKLSHKTKIVNGEKIYKIQWKNMGFKGCSVDDSLNMQMWVFENSNKVQFRYGKSNMTSLGILNNPDTPIVAVEVEALNDYYYATFNGAPNNYTWAYMDPNGRSIGIPAEGMVIEIRSTESPVSVDFSKNGTNILIKDFSNYLEFVFENKTIKLQKITILDLNGKVISSCDQSKIDISLLNPTLYTIKIETNAGVYFRKYIKK